VGTRWDFWILNVNINTVNRLMTFSSGGLVALGLRVQNLPVEEYSKAFKVLSQKIFSRPFLIRAPFTKLSTHSLETALSKVFDKELLFVGKNYLLKIGPYKTCWPWSLGFGSRAPRTLVGLELLCRGIKLLLPSKPTLLLALVNAKATVKSVQEDLKVEGDGTGRNL
jgi:hypothetical protein